MLATSLNPIYLFNGELFHHVFASLICSSDTSDGNSPFLKKNISATPPSSGLATL
jgi:hypothetical protein